MKSYLARNKVDSNVMMVGKPIIRRLRITFEQVLVFFLKLMLTAIRTYISLNQ
jgi:hypothetical protein